MGLFYLHLCGWRRRTSAPQSLPGCAVPRLPLVPFGLRPVRRPGEALGQLRAVVTNDRVQLLPGEIAGALQIGSREVGAL